jgi:hypothetical protein
MERLWVQDLVDRAVPAASELVTNAVVHTKGPLRLAADPGDPETEGGRGLAIVEQLTIASKLLSYALA